MKKYLFNAVCLLLIVSLFISHFSDNPGYSFGAFSDDESGKFGNLVSVILEGGYSADYGEDILFSDAEDSGCLYLLESGSDDCVKLSDKSASYINVVGKDIYFVTHNDIGYEIIKLNIGGHEKVLYSSNDEISHLYVSANGMYFLIGKQVFCFDFTTNECLCMYENEKMYAFVPSSEGDIFWLEKKTETIDTASCDNCSEGTEEKNIDFRAYRFDSSIGISSEISFYEVLNSNNSQVQNNQKSLNTLKLFAEVGDRRIPTEEYPVGSYFTDNGEACDDHRTDVCGYETEEMCNCKAFHNGKPLYAVQCYGYARYLYLHLFDQIGLPESKENISLGTLSEGNVTLEAFKKLFENAKPGAQMRVTYYKPDGVTISNHSLIILDWNEDGFSACESNLDGHCGVFVKKRAFDEYVPTLISVDLFIIPANYPDIEEETETTLPSDKDGQSGLSDSTFFDDDFMADIGKLIKEMIVFFSNLIGVAFEIFTGVLV